MTDIYIVRHGNTFDKGDVVTRVGARTDLPLSRSGFAQAEALGANAILNVRYSTSSVTSGASELFVYGTAVRIE